MNKAGQGTKTAKGKAGQRRRVSGDSEATVPVSNEVSVTAELAPVPAPEPKSEPEPERPRAPEPKLKTETKPRRGAAPFDMSVRVGTLELKNPVLAAAGTFGYGIEFEDIVSLEKLGGFVVKGLSREPMAGNPPPRLYETAAGMLNAIGLQNIGARAFVEEKLPQLRRIPNTVVITNVFGHTTRDIEETIRILNDGEGIAAYELNVSCPNVTYGGIAFGQDPALLEEAVACARGVAERPLIVKLSPNVTSIARMARAAEDAGAAAVSLVNTFLAMSIDPETRRPRISNVTAGLSGPCIKPIAVRMVHEAAQAVKIPVIGMGGISTAADIVEFMLAGASAVEVGTANFWDPCACEKLVDELERWCLGHRVRRVAELTGGLIT